MSKKRSYPDAMVALVKGLGELHVNMKEIERMTGVPYYTVRAYIRGERGKAVEPDQRPRIAIEELASRARA